METSEETRFPNCDTEEIQFLGQIQPSGYLIQADRQEQRIRYVSANAGELGAWSATDLLGRPLEELFTPSLWEDVQALKEGGQLFLHRDELFPSLSGFLQKHEHWILLELEAALPSSPTHDSSKALAKLMLCEHEEALMNCYVEQASELLGLDRVMLYRFEPDHSGVVTAEVNHSQEQDYLHLRFPAGDIPQNARKLYLQNPLRLIRDVEQDPLPVLRQEGWPAPDLSHSLLRAVAPVHRQYLRNMKVRAALSMPIQLKEGELYALLSAHHAQPLQLDSDRRILLQELTENFRFQLRHLNSQARMKFMDFRANRIQWLAQQLLDQLIDGDPASLEQELLDMCQASGLIIQFQEKLFQLGLCPETSFLERLQEQLDQSAPFGTYVTDSCAALHSGLAPHAEQASGLMAAWSHGRQQAGRQLALYWVKPEQVREVDWGGKPPDGDNEVKLAPRRSFQKWRQAMYQHSSPWSEQERFAASTLMLAWQKLPGLT